MTLRFTIPGKLLALSGVAVFFVIAVGAAGYATTRSVADATRQILDDGAALKFHMQADMAHDALHADVLAALLQDEAGTDEATVRKDLAEHAGEIRMAVQELQRLPMDAATRAALRDVRPVLDAYVSQATAIVNLAFTDRAAAQARMGAFMRTFHQAEKEMADLSEQIARRSRDIHAQSTHAASVATWSIVGAMLACAAVLLTTSLLIGRSIVRRVRYAVQIAETVATGDFSSRIDARGTDESAQLLQALARMNGSLGQLVGTVHQASGTTPTAASPARVHVDSTQQASRIAATASDCAARSGEAVQRLVTTMSGITEASRRITDIIAVIDDIAFQTNILALNLGAEAARVGEQDRGFAALAAEVRTLAQRSAAAAKEIKSLVEASVDQVTAGERQASQAGHGMADVVEQVRQMTRLLAEITSVTAQPDKAGDRQAARLVDAVGQFQFGDGQRRLAAR